MTSEDPSAQEKPKLASRVHLAPRETGLRPGQVFTFLVDPEPEMQLMEMHDRGSFICLKFWQLDPHIPTRDMVPKEELPLGYFLWLLRIGLARPSDESRYDPLEIAVPWPGGEFANDAVPGSGIRISSLEWRRNRYGWGRCFVRSRPIEGPRKKMPLVALDDFWRMARKRGLRPRW